LASSDISSLLYSTADLSLNSNPADDASDPFEDNPFEVAREFFNCQAPVSLTTTSTTPSPTKQSGKKVAFVVYIDWSEIRRVLYLVSPYVVYPPHPDYLTLAGLHATPQSMVSLETALSDSIQLLRLNF
jgi:hypothetical protein